MIIFKEVEIEGFGSILEPLSFKLDWHQIMIIRGRNGIGKSTRLNALYWGLFGDTLKEDDEIPTWPHKRDVNFQGTRVMIKFKDGTTIHRFLDYKGKHTDGKIGGNRLIFSKSQEKHKKHIQADIEKYLGLTPSVFKNSVMFGQRAKRLIDDKSTDKKKVLEEIITDDFINKAIDKVKNDLTNDKAQQHIIEKEISSANIEKERLERLRSSKIDNYKHQLEVYNLKKENLNKEIKLLSKQDNSNKEDDKRLSELRDKVKLKEKSYKKWDEEITKLKVQRDVEIRDIVIIEMEVSSAKNKLEDKSFKCEHCDKVFGEIPKETKKLYKKELEEKEKEEKALKAKHRETKTLILELQQKINNFEKLEYSLKKEEEKAKKPSVEPKIKKLKQELKTLTAPVEPNLDKYDKDINNLEKSIKTNTKILNKVIRNIEFLNWVLKEPLSNKGIKNYLFELILKKLNSYLDEMTDTYLNFKPQFYIDKDSANQNINIDIFTSDGNLVTYGALSGGEKQLINIIVSLSLYKLITENVQVNILALDELFENIDDDNVAIVSSLISDLAKDKTIFIITHRKSFSILNSQDINIQ